MSTPEERERWRARYRQVLDRRARRIANRSERCGLCGYARINVIHETDREHAPEGLEYYADIPFCPFEPTGRQFR